MERSVSVYGSSSALRGVQLKIGEKFKPPAKVTLPVGWKTRDPSQILGLKYDFSLEEEVIKKATTERQAKEQEKNAQRNKELLTPQHSSPVIANMGGDILMPTTVTSPGATIEKENKQQFNYKDFEENSDSPFELVELQSINNMDALKSVLQPQLQNNVPAVSVSVTPSDGVQDTPGADANIPYRQTATDDNQAIKPSAKFTTTASTTQVTQSSSIASSSISSNVPQFCQSSYPNNPMPGQHIVNQGLNARQDQNLHRPQNPKSYSLPVDNQMPDHMSVGSMNIPSSPQQNSHIPSFNNKIMDGNVPMPGAKKVLPPPPARPPPRRPQSTGNTYLDASLPAIVDGAAAASVNEQNRPVPKPRSKLPPIKNHPDSSVVPPPLPPKKLNVKKQGYENVHKPLSEDIDNHLKFCPSLPPISPPATLDNPPTITSGSFPSTSTMSSEELQFVNKLSSMGFPAARAARAINNFGCKEREVVEFLIAFNGLCDRGYNEELVELVLKENNSNQEKAETFLNLLSQFKELGFPEEKIFDALKKSECDSNKTLDILTCTAG